MNSAEIDNISHTRSVQFYIPAGYSDFWRRDRSSSEAIELTRLLKAIRKIAAYVGRNTGEIVWEGMAGPENKISLDPTPVLGIYPVPGANADVVIGLAVQKCFNRTEFSDRLIRRAMDRIRLPAPYVDKFRRFAEMAEQIHADCLANESVLGYYVEAARMWQIAVKRASFIRPPTLEELLHLWWKMAAHRSGQKYLEPFFDRSAGGLTERNSLEKLYRTPLKHLNRIVGSLMHECRQVPGKNEQVEARITLYLSAWPRLLELIRFWPVDGKDRFLLGDHSVETAAAEECLMQNELMRAVKRSMKRVEERMQGSTKDFTDKVRTAVDNHKEVVSVEFDDIVTPAEDRTDRNLLWRCKRVLYSVATRNTTKVRGLSSGKIDRRRLYRAATTGCVFQLRKNNFSLNHDVVLLVDYSGSMDEPYKLARCETLYQTLFTAVQTVNKKARLFGYNELRNICRVTELYQWGRFHSILPHGKTASGEAIISTAMGICNRKGRSPLLFHITDGAANWGCGVNGALAFCRRHNINLMTLGLDCHPDDQSNLKKEYGDKVQFVDQLKNVPAILERLLHTLRQR